MTALQVLRIFVATMLGCFFVAWVCAGAASDTAGFRQLFWGAMMFTSLVAGVLSLVGTAYFGVDWLDEKTREKDASGLIDEDYWRGLEESNNTTQERNE